MKMTKAMKSEVKVQFENATTYEDLKKAYVERVTEFSGNGTAIKYIDGIFKACVDGVKDTHKNAKGETYKKDTGESHEAFIALVNELIAMNGVTVEVCGTWLWVSGNTKENKEALKACGFRYAAKKKMWYKAPEGSKHFRGKKSWEMSKIREVYGSKMVETAEEVE